MILGLPETERDQCQVQILADVLNTADVWLHSLLPEETVRACHLQPVRDIAMFLREMRTTDAEMPDRSSARRAGNDTVHQKMAS